METCSQIGVEGKRSKITVTDLREENQKQEKETKILTVLPDAQLGFQREYTPESCLQELLIKWHKSNQFYVCVVLTQI